MLPRDNEQHLPHNIRRRASLSPVMIHLRLLGKVFEIFFPALLPLRLVMLGWFVYTRIGIGYGGLIVYTWIVYLCLVW
jgi:hypothetical protein